METFDFGVDGLAFCTMDDIQRDKRTFVINKYFCFISIYIKKNHDLPRHITPRGGSLSYG